MNIMPFMYDNRKLGSGTIKTMARVYKILIDRDWQMAMQTGAYSGSDDDIRDGFIHLSAQHQLSGTAEKHYRGKPGLVLVAFEETDLGADLKWEISRGGDRFPHLYAALPVKLALWTKPLALGQDGVPQLPAEL